MEGQGAMNPLLFCNRAFEIGIFQEICFIV